MWKQFIKDYFSFTKKERVGILVLAAIIIAVFLLPYMIPLAKTDMPTAQEIAVWKKEVDQLKNGADTGSINERAGPYQPESKIAFQKQALFYFDPNTLAAADWKRLGLRDKTIQTIQNYLGKGGHFRKPADLEKIYGLSAREVERLLPFVQITGYKENDRRTQSNNKTVQSDIVRKGAAVIADINSADTAAFIALPGIGSKLAARIVHFRDKLGGFYSVDQVGETFGLADSVFQKVKPLLRYTNSAIRQLNINTADAAALKQHPYIGWRLAGLIVAYRKEHGDFKQVDDVMKIEIITPELFGRLKSYLSIESP
jgi:competence protein ComEA